MCTLPRKLDLQRTGRLTVLATISDPFECPWSGVAGHLPFHDELQVELGMRLREQ